MKRWFSFLVFGLSLLLFVPPGLAFSQFGRTGDNVVIEADEVIDQSFIAVSGETVEVYGTVTGDLYVAGGSVYIDGLVEGDVFAAGGQVFVGGEVLGDVRAAGGSLNLDGTIGGNLTIAGGNITVGKASQIDGGGLIAGGNIALQGTVNQQTMIASGTSILSGLIGGNTEIYGGQLTVAPTAVIEGELAHNSDMDISISPNASVAAGVREIEVPDYQVENQVSEEEIAKAGAVFSFGFNLIGFVSMLVVGLLMVTYLPNFMVTTIRQFGLEKWKTAGVGLLTIVMAPVVALILFITIFLIPLSFGLLTIYGLGFFFASIYFSYWLGRVIANRLNRNWGRQLVFFVGALVLFILKLIPVINILVGIAVAIIGYGMVVLGEIETFKAGRKAKIL